MQRALSREVQDLSGRVARLERAVGVGRVGPRERGADPDVELAGSHGVEQLARTPGELVTGGDVVVQRGAGQEERAARVEALGVDRRHRTGGAAEQDEHPASLRRRGTLVLFGASSGPVPPVDPQRLNSGGSLFLTRPTLGDYTATRDELVWRSRELFDAVLAGELAVRVGATFSLADAADAHRALESRHTTGKVLLLP